VVLDGYAGRRMLERCRSRLSHFPKTYAEGAGSSESNPAPPRPDPLRVWARIAPSFGGLWRLQTFVCVRGVSAIPHIYTSVLQALAGWGYAGRLEGCFQGYRGEAMQDLGYELPRIPILGTSVNNPSFGTFVRKLVKTSGIHRRLLVMKLEKTLKEVLAG